MTAFFPLPLILPFLLSLRLLGLPKAKMLCAYNPSKDKDVIVNSMFTATRHFHVSPVHSRVSADVLLETMLGQSARVSCFPWP